jgi:hypothetical protein
MAVPEGAQLSDDGYYWWDGEQWQPVDQESSDPAAAGASSEDEDIAVRIEGSLDEEQEEISLDEMVAEGFEPEDAEEAMA